MKKRKLMSIFSIIITIIGTLALLSAIVLWYHGEDMKKWLGAIVVSILLILGGVSNIKNSD